MLWRAAFLAGQQPGQNAFGIRMLIEPLDHLQTQRTRDGIDVLNVTFGGRQQADKMFDVVPLLPPGGRKEQLHRMIVPFDLWRLTAVVDGKLRHLTK